MEELGKNYKICIQKLSNDCLEISVKENFRKGRCLPCAKERQKLKNRIYYAANKDKIYLKRGLTAKTENSD